MIIRILERATSRYYKLIDKKKINKVRDVT